jgi:hypothetical protein
VSGEERAEPTAEERRRRRERRERVFGEVLPDRTRDEQADPGDGDSGGDEWLRRQVPPHHGG